MLNPEPRTGTRAHQELVAVGIPIVRRMAFRMARRLPPNISVDDLISAGNEGLSHAIRSFDPNRGDHFERYAESRIRGAILDELRSWDVMTRHGRRKLTEVSRAIHRLEGQLGRAPDEGEIAAELGLSLEDYHRLCGELARGPALGRAGELSPDDMESGFADPCAMIGEKQLKAHLVEAIGELSERQRTVIGLYYQEECTQAEIGEILGLTESRVCQILGEIAARLRAKLVRMEWSRRPTEKRPLKGETGSRPKAQ